MGLFSSSKTTTTTDVNSFNTAEISVTPTTNVGISLDNSASANAISAGIAALGGAGEALAQFLGGGLAQGGNSIGDGLTASGTAIGGGIKGAGSNIAFALLAGVSLYALTRN